MSVHTAPQAAKGMGKKITASTIRESKGVKKLAALTAYDFPTAVMLDEAGLDLMLVGDSLGMAVLGRSDTVSVTLDEMIHHASVVVAGATHALVVADMPFMTYELSVEDALRNATRLAQESGVRAVKLEGGVSIKAQIRALVDIGIPVLAHIGLTPQRAASLGGFKVQGKTASAAKAIMEDALAVQDAGAFAVVLEAVPAPLAAMITKELVIPTIGIGAGPDCDGQILVVHDMLGLNQGHVPKFVKQYAKLAEIGKKAVQEYVKDVATGSFPAPEHCFSMPEAEVKAMHDSINKRGMNFNPANFK